MYQVLIVVYLIVAIMLIGLVLLQRGKGADMGASFGAGASNTVFGAGGSGNFLTRSTAVLATAFFVISLLLGSMTAQQAKETDELDIISVPAAEEVPVDDVPQKPQDEIPE